MRQIRFLYVMTQLRVIAFRFFPHQPVRFRGIHPQIHDQVFLRQSVNFVFQFLQPAQKFIALLARHPRALMRKIGSHIPISQHDSPSVQIFRIPGAA